MLSQFCSSFLIFCALKNTLVLYYGFRIFSETSPFDIKKSTFWPEKGLCKFHGDWHFKRRLSPLFFFSVFFFHFLFMFLKRKEIIFYNQQKNKDGLQWIYWWDIFFHRSCFPIDWSITYVILMSLKKEENIQVSIIRRIVSLGAPSLPPIELTMS